jgi:hypothetical protein
MSVVDELMGLEHRWNDTDWEKRKYGKKNLS